MFWRKGIDNLEKTKDERYRLMVETPVRKLILKLAVPTIISMLVTGLYNSADTFFVGKISTEATAAVGIVFSVMAIIQAMGFFCGHGSGNYIARMLGSGNHKEANEAASTGFALAVILGLITAACGIAMSDRIAHLLGGNVSPQTISDSKSYMTIILLGAPLMMGQFVINNQLRFQGNAMYAMIGLMAGAVINVALDPLLIFVFNMGVKGAAWATVGGQTVSFFVLFAGVMRGNSIHLSIKNVRLNVHYIFEIVNGGAPSLFRQGLASIATIMLNKAAGDLGGDAAIAGMSVATRVLMLLSCALIGFGQGFQPMCSYNYGAGLGARVKEGFTFCVKYGTIFLLGIAAVCFAFAPQIIAMFRDDPDVIEVGTAALRFQSLTLPLMGFTVITNMMLQSMGKGLKATITSSARNGIFFIPFILILPKLFGLTGVESTQAAADLCALLLAIPFAVSELGNLSQTKETNRDE